MAALIAQTALVRYGHESACTGSDQGLLQPIVVPLTVATHMTPLGRSMRTGQACIVLPQVLSLFPSISDLQSLSGERKLRSPLFQFQFCLLFISFLPPAGDDSWRWRALAG